MTVSSGPASPTRRLREVTPPVKAFCKQWPRSLTLFGFGNEGGCYQLPLAFHLAPPTGGAKPPETHLTNRVCKVLLSFHFRFSLAAARRDATAAANKKQARVSRRAFIILNGNAKKKKKKLSGEKKFTFQWVLEKSINVTLD